MDLPQRKLQRLTDYDYSTPGAYFVTICTHEKRPIFGEIRIGENFGDAQMNYSPIGEIAKSCLLEIEHHHPAVKIENWVIMPNHVHLLLGNAIHMEQMYPFPTAHISVVVGTYKAAVTRAVGNKYMRSGKLWQKSFYDHIVRNEEDYLAIWNYICGNPSKWLEDCFYSN